MPRPGPPVTPRHGHLHAVGGRQPLPVGPSPVCDPGDSGVEGAGLGAVTDARAVFAETAPAAPILVRTLDAGRLAARDLLGALGWGPRIALDATLSGPHRVVISDRWRDPGPQRVAGAHTVHTDAKGQLLVPESLRTWLGVTGTDVVVARIVDRPDHEPALELLNPAVVHAALDATPPTADARQPLTAVPAPHQKTGEPR